MPRDDDTVERALLRLLRPKMSAPEVDVEKIDRVRFKRGLLRGNERAADSSRRPARIFVLERLSTRTLSIFWSDPQSGHYAEQTWRLGLARTNGICVLSGRPISAGEEVFRPRCSVTYIPANSKHMILSSVFSDSAISQARAAI